MIVTLVALITTALGAWFDIKSREIPQWVTAILIVAGVIASLYYQGVWVTLATFVLGAIICELFFRWGVFGGGDLKLLWGLALLFGPVAGLVVFYYSLLASLPLFLFYMIKEKGKKPQVPYAVAILAAVCWAIWPALRAGVEALL